MRKGDKLEKDYSLEIHKRDCPVLISSLLLRSLNAGQVDVACLKKSAQGPILFLYECKSSPMISFAQRKRLLRAQDYLSRVLEMGVKLEVKFCQKDEA